jgi:hypothetical protein
MSCLLVLNLHVQNLLGQVLLPFWKIMLGWQPHVAAAGNEAVTWSPSLCVSGGQLPHSFWSGCVTAYILKHTLKELQITFHLFFSLLCY